MLWKFFLIAIFIMLQKNTFGQNFFKFLARVQKCYFGKNEKLPKFHNMSQGLPNPGFTQEKVQKGDFLKKPSRELKNYFCFRFL